MNLGTPEAPATPQVRQYLNEFLMDPEVIDLPWLLRRLLVSGVILPFRPKKTAEAYAAIWTSAGSPLLINTRALADGMAACFPGPVRFAMRYGNPPMSVAIGELAALTDRVLIAPLYPHYARSTTQTTLDHASRIVRKLGLRLELCPLPAFFDQTGYIEHIAATIRPHLAGSDRLLLSYHGLPERHIKKADPTAGHCLAQPNCCEMESVAHLSCYRHQVRVTSRLVAKRLGLQAGSWQLGFQSRLGRAPWLKPYTDELLRQLPTQGVRRLIVACPAFVVDNLETLEEINIRGRRIFLDAGGEDFVYVPCLNDDPAWIETLGGLCRAALV